MPDEARDPGVPSPAECRSQAGVFAPVVDRSRCEAKRACVEVCPYSVFEVRRIADEDYAKLGLLAKLKVTVHGKQSAYTPKAYACRACGLCVKACPEGAIRLARV